MSNKNNGNGKAMYRGAVMVGFEVKNNGNSIIYTPEEMLELHKHYEYLIRKGSYDGAVGAEVVFGFPNTWLNDVVHGLCEEINDDGLMGKVNEARGELTRKLELEKLKNSVLYK